tara:strand:+ start:742 stop:1080 length:339 start_codon:yes stop_codon:yes gene_type:complete
MKMIKNSDLEFYQNLHQNKINLIIHMVGSVTFILGNVGFFSSLIVQNYTAAISSVFLIILSIIIQGVGHTLEPVPFKGFKGPIDFVKIIYLELFIIFPVFLFSPYFKENWKK